MFRRRFLSAAAGLTTLPIALPHALANPLRAFPTLANAKNGIGIQLWTVRNLMEADPEGTLTAIAKAGYEQIELGNVVNSEEVVAIAKEKDLKVRSSFFNWETIANPNPNSPKLETVIETAKKFGLEYLVFGYIGKSARDTSDKLKKIADDTNEAAEKVRQAGMKLSYHNHSFEFETLDNGQTGFDIFKERFDRELVNFELDVFWAAIGGWDPVETLKDLGPRVGQIHLKDLKQGVPVIYDEGKVPKDAFQEVGDGTLNMKAIMEVALANGVQQFHVEQDESPDPIASINQSAKYIAANLW